MSPETRQKAIHGALLGAAIGDAIALPFEGVSKRRVAKLLGKGPLRHRLLLGRGYCSDDTEHTCLVAQALLAAGDDIDPARFVATFRHDLAWRLRWWLWGLPAGIGLATLRALIKHWFMPWRDGDGVFSAGNGPAMRAAIVGACLSERPSLLREVVRATTTLTHTDPRAFHGALAVALATAIAARGEAAPGATLRRELQAAAPDAGEFLAALDGVMESVAKLESTADFAASLGCAKGVSGYVMHTVPVALHVWLRRRDDHAGAIDDIVRCGGDTDTVAAIVGGIVGAACGPQGIPADWQAGLAEWPRNRRWLDTLAHRLCERWIAGKAQAPLPLNLVGLMLRNVVFMIVVLGHGFRRLLPPY